MRLGFNEGKDMKIRDLAEYCEAICIDCDNCVHTAECNNLQNELEDISPYSLIDILDRNVDISED